MITKKHLELLVKLKDRLDLEFYPGEREKLVELWKKKSKS